MQAVPGQAHGLWRFGFIKPRQNFLDGFDQIKPNAAAVVAFVQSLQAAMF
jgi:hypothetical protein